MAAPRYRVWDEDAGKSTNVNTSSEADSSNFTKINDSPSTSKEISGTRLEKGDDSKKTVLSGISCGPFLGLFYTFLCSLFLALSSVIVKKMTYISPGQLSLVRNAGVFVGSIPIAVFAGENFFGPKKYRFMLFMRGFLGATALYLNLLAYRLLPLAEAAIILSTTPAVVMILARIYLKERCGIVQCSALVITILGVLLSVRIPELIKDREFRFTVDYIKGLAYAVGCVLCLAVAFVSMRKMKDVHFSVLLLYMGLVGVAENAGLTAVFSFFDLPRCGWDPILMMAVGFFGWVGHCFMTLAIQAEAVGIVSVVRASLDIVIALVFQVMFFGNPPDVYNSCGAIFVILSVSAIGLSKWLLQLPEDAKARRYMKFLLL